MEIFFNDVEKLMNEAAFDRSRDKVNASFSRFGYNIQRVELILRDINGPKGGVDKECRVVVKLKRMGDISVSVKDHSLSKAISRCISRAERAVSRKIDRRSIKDSGRESRLGVAFYD